MYLAERLGRALKNLHAQIPPCEGAFEDDHLEGKRRPDQQVKELPWQGRDESSIDLLSTQYSTKRQCLFT